MLTRNEEQLGLYSYRKIDIYEYTSLHLDELATQVYFGVNNIRAMVKIAG